VTRSRTPRLAWALAGAAFVAAAAPSRAQVGYDPPASPFRDLEYRQELTVFGGYFNAGTDVAGVAPQSGPAVGLRYELRIGGPVQLMVRATRVDSERQLVDAGVAAPARNFAVRSQPLYVADVGLSLNLTGQRTYRGFIPVVNGGFGIASDFEGDADQQSDTTRRGYKFGTPFAFSFGGGLRWTRGGRFQLRADVADYLYQIKYPASFYAAPTGVTPVLDPDVKQNQWKHNVALTLGGSYLFFR
jgi:hypothetical protein